MVLGFELKIWINWFGRYTHYYNSHLDKQLDYNIFFIKVLFKNTDQFKNKLKIMNTIDRFNLLGIHIQFQYCQLIFIISYTNDILQSYNFLIHNTHYKVFNKLTKDHASSSS